MTGMRKITAVNYYPLQYSALRGGGVRFYYIYKHLSAFYDIVLLAFTGSKSGEEKVTDRFRIIDIRYGKLFFWIMRVLRRLTFVPDNFGVLTDLFYSLNLDSNHEKTVKEAVEKADVLIIEHPYLVEVLTKFRKKQILVYDAHNVEYSYQKMIMSKTFFGNLFSNYVRRLENAVCKKSDLIFAVSREDKEELANLYGVSREKIRVIPNGADVDKIKPISIMDREQSKNKLNMGSKATILFVGAIHDPNMTALEYIAFKLAPTMENYSFLIVGDIAEVFLKKYGKGVKDRAKNIVFYGLLSNQDKEDVFKASDIAINPMFTGSGTNIKMLEYMAAGIPVVSTPVGARGLQLEDKQHALICDTDDFKTAIERLFADEGIRNNLASNARRLVEEKYDWKKIAAEMDTAISGANGHD